MAPSLKEVTKDDAPTNTDDTTQPPSKRKRTASKKMAEHLNSPTRGKKVIGATSYGNAQDKSSTQPVIASFFANANKTKPQSEEMTATNAKQQNSDDNESQKPSNSTVGAELSLEDRIAKCKMPCGKYSTTRLCQYLSKAEYMKVTRSIQYPLYSGDEGSEDQFSSDDDDSLDKVANNIPYMSPKNGGGMQIVDQSGNVISQFENDKCSSGSSSSSNSSDSDVESIESDNEDKSAITTKKKKKEKKKVIGNDLIKASRFIKPHPSTVLSNKSKSKKGTTKSLPIKKSRVSVKHSNDILKKSMQWSVDKGMEICVEVDSTKDLEEEKWTLVTATKATAKWWHHFKKISYAHHKNYPNHAMCLICLKAGKPKKGTVSTKNGSTGGLSRHLSAHHLKEFDALNTPSGGIKTAAPSDSGIHILDQLGAITKPKKLSNEDVKKLWRVAAVSWAITENVSLRMFTRPSFRNMFVPLNKEALNIVNANDRGIREDIMYLGKVAQEATRIELARECHKITWTTDHWTGPDNETYTTTTGHYIDTNWKMQANVLDFSVFEGSTTGARIYTDVKRVLDSYSGECVLIYDVMGITDTTGNMGVLGQHCRRNGKEHAYCTDHNFHLNATLAFDRKFTLYITLHRFVLL